MKEDDIIKTGSRVNDSFSSKLFLPALVAASFASGPITVLAALLLIDIGNSFGTIVGVTGQINTSYAVVAVIFAFLTSALSLRFRYKSLFLLGLSLMAVSALGCSLAPNFMMFLVFYSISGAGYSIVNPMTFTFIGEQYPLEKRTGAMKYIYRLRISDKKTD